MERVFEPFALEIYRRYLDGETIRDLAGGLKIPEDRIVQRLRAAELYYGREETRKSIVALRAWVRRAGETQPV